MFPPTLGNYLQSFDHDFDRRLIVSSPSPAPQSHLYRVSQRVCHSRPRFRNCRLRASLPLCYGFSLQYYSASF